MNSASLVAVHAGPKPYSGNVRVPVGMGAISRVGILRVRELGCQSREWRSIKRRARVNNFPSWRRVNFCCHDHASQGNQIAVQAEVDPAANRNGSPVGEVDSSRPRCVRELGRVSIKPRFEPETTILIFNPIGREAQPPRPVIATGTCLVMRVTDMARGERGGVVYLSRISGPAHGRKLEPENGLIRF